MTTVGFNPYAMKLKHIMTMEQAFKVKFVAMVKRLEAAGETATDDLTGAELAAMVYMVKVMNGENPLPSEILDMDFSEMEAAMSSVVAPEKVVEDPH